MYFPKLIELVHKRPNIYTSDIVSKVEDYLGNLEQGTVFNEQGLGIYISDVLLIEKILEDLVDIGLIAREEDEDSFDEENNETIKSYVLLINPKKFKDENYQEYISKKRQIDSFSIIYEKTKAQHSGALTLIDLKGYSKNVNSTTNNAAILLLIEKIQSVIDECIKPYFLNRYSGIEIKHNGDGWFLYFLNEHDACDFLESVIIQCKENTGIKNDFNSLGTTLKCYIHHAKEIEKIYKVDTLRFDMEGQDVILIHMLEKPIEKKLYESAISKNSSFIAITETVLAKIDRRSKDFKELEDIEIDVKDTDGNSKVLHSDLKVFYKEFAIA